MAIACNIIFGRIAASIPSLPDRSSSLWSYARLVGPIFVVLNLLSAGVTLAGAIMIAIAISRSQAYTVDYPSDIGLVALKIGLAVQLGVSGLLAIIGVSVPFAAQRWSKTPSSKSGRANGYQGLLWTVTAGSIALVVSYT
jgi:hypothetical protein